MTSTRWIFVRHGESTANASRVLSGHWDVPLTERGRAQAVALRPALAPHRIARVVSSDLQRAHDTARLAGHGRPWAVRALPRLRERHLGAWQGLSLDGPDAPIARSVLSTFDGRPPRGESLQDVALRALAALAALDDGRPTAVFAHGGMIRSVLAVLEDGADPATFADRHVRNAVPHVVDVPRGTWDALRADLASR